MTTHNILHVVPCSATIMPKFAMEIIIYTRQDIEFPQDVAFLVHEI